RIRSSDFYLFPARPYRAAPARAERRELRDSDPDPASGDPATAGRARRARRGADRHRQDRRLRAADPAAARRHARSSPAEIAPRPRADADPRTRAPDRRELPQLRPLSAPRQAVIFGGVGQQPQVAAMARGVDILVATPGRLLDLMNRRHVRFDGLGFLV